MSVLVYIITYLSIFIFLGAVLKRIVAYIKNPIHVRWELYPVPHEGGGRAEYGGSYLEEQEWWNKKREISKLGELKVMIPEMLFLKAVWEHNRPLWYVSFPFHFGLYLIMAFFGTLFISVVAGLAGLGGASFMVPIAALTNFLGPAGFLLAICGAIGLLFKRFTDESLKNYSSPEHYFNLLLFIAAIGAATLTWLFVDPTFAIPKKYITDLLTFNFVEIKSGLFIVAVLLSVLTIAYIPLTHMSHFFMKYFLYHDIRWGDEPNINTPETDAKIGVVLNYPVSWSASHIAGHGKETWAEVATFNPVAEPAKEKE